MNYIKALEEFQDKFEMKPDVHLWTKLVDEEMEELLKEMADVIYVLAGQQVALNRTGHFAKNFDKSLIDDTAKAFSKIFGKDRVDEAFKRVHESNLSKLDDEGKPVRREDGKIMKGPNYKPPVLGDLV